MQLPLFWLFLAAHCYFLLFALFPLQCVLRFQYRLGDMSFCRLCLFLGLIRDTAFPRNVKYLQKRLFARRLRCLKNIIFLFLLARIARAGKETRTPDPNLGKVMLYQLSYSRLSISNIEI